MKSEINNVKNGIVVQTQDYEDSKRIIGISNATVTSVNGGVPPLSKQNAFTVEEINAKIVDMLRPEDVQTPIEIVYQSIEGLHHAIPHHKGDWYFTGRYPTPGGTRLCNQAFVHYIERLYQ